MAVTVVQRAHAQDNNGASGYVQATFASPTTAGNTIIAIGCMASTTNTGLSVATDDNGNTYTNIANISDGTHYAALYVCYAIDTAGGQSNVYLGDISTANLHVYEVSGLTASSFDKIAHAYQTGASAMNSGNLPSVTSNNNELLLGVFMQDANHTYTAGTGFSNGQTQANSSFSSFTEEQIVSKLGEYNATATASATSTCLSAILTFKAPATVAGSFSWKGYTWYRRDNTSPGSPMYNGNYDPSNVSDPDVNDYVTLEVSNPSGTYPAAAEMFTVDPGTGQFGYGTYTFVVGSALNTIPSGFVWGSLFTYEDQATSPPVSVTNNEIDLGETSDWGNGGTVTTSHNYFIDSSGVKTGVDDPYNTTADAVVTHVLQWLPTQLIMDSYVGTGTGGTNLKHTVITSNVPVPTGKEFMDINAWVTSGSSNTPSTTPATSVVVRDFTFVPLATGQNFFF